MADGDLPLVAAVREVVEQPLQFKVESTLEILKTEKGGSKTSKLAWIIKYDKGLALCQELLPASEVTDVGADYDSESQPGHRDRFRSTNGAAPGVSTKLMQPT